MRKLRLLDAYRSRYLEREIYNCEGGDAEGIFLVPGPLGKTKPLQVIASSGGGWDHVSVSATDRPPKEFVA